MFRNRSKDPWRLVADLLSPSERQITKVATGLITPLATTSSELDFVVDEASASAFVRPGFVLVSDRTIYGWFEVQTPFDQQRLSIPINSTTGMEVHRSGESAVWSVSLIDRQGLEQCVSFELKDAKTFQRFNEPLLEAIGKEKERTGLGIRPGDEPATP